MEAFWVYSLRDPQGALRRSGARRFLKTASHILPRIDGASPASDNGND